MTNRRGGRYDLPEWQRSRSLKGFVYFEERHGKTYAHTWPKKRGKPKSNTTKTQNSLFAETVKAVRYVDPEERAAAEIIAQSTVYTWRDVLFMAMHGTYIEVEGLDSMAITDDLDLISNVPGAMLYRGPDHWVGLLPPSEGAVLAFDVATQLPFWIVPEDTAIRELHGDVIAGPGPGDVEATLSETGVVPGTYYRATIEVDAKGRITDAVSGDADAGITQLTGDVTAGPGSGSQVATLANTTVDAGDYHHASITVDSAGRITDAADGAVATSSAVGLVKPDNDTIVVDGSGVISVDASALSGGGLFAGLMVPTPTDAAIFTSWTNQNGSTVSDNDLGIEIVPGLSHVGTSWSYRKKATSGTEFQVKGVLNLAGVGANVKQAMVGFGDGTKLHIIRIFYFSGAWSIYCTNYNNTTTANANTPASQTLTGTQIAFRFGFDASNYWFDISQDGATWLRLTSGAKTGSFLGASGFTYAVFGAHADADAAVAGLIGWQETITP